MLIFNNYLLINSLFVEKIPQHSEYRNSEVNEKAVTKANCKNIFPIAEQLKSKLLVKYQTEYDLWLSHKVVKHSLNSLISSHKHFKNCKTFIIVECVEYVCN